MDDPFVLSGSPQHIIELLYYSIHAILFHREIYTREEFDIQPKYGQSQYIIADPEVQQYIDSCLAQTQGWIEQGSITHFVLVILSKEDGKTLERWTFDLSRNRPSEVLSKTQNGSSILGDSIKGAQGPSSPIQDASSDLSVPNLLKQISVAAATFLPELPTPGVFNLLTYVSEEVVKHENREVLEQWNDVTDEDGSYPYDPATETQQTQLRGIKTKKCDVDLLLTALDD